MKNTIVFFCLALLLVFTSISASGVSSLEDKGNTVFVVIAKMGQPITSFEIPSRFAIGGTKLAADVSVEVIDPLSGRVILSAISKNNSINLPNLKSGQYLLVLKMLDFTQKELVSF